MEDTAQLWTLSFAMFLGSFVAGAVPLTISLSEVSNGQKYFSIDLGVIQIAGREFHTAMQTFTRR